MTTVSPPAVVIAVVGKRAGGVKRGADEANIINNNVATDRMELFRAEQRRKDLEFFENLNSDQGLALSWV